MSLLDVNDRPGVHAPSLYADDVPGVERSHQDGDVTADVVIVGGGLTGLSSALTLAERGVSVVLIDAHRVGWGASGRNGGQLGSGQRLDQPSLERRHGPALARQLWELAEDARADVLSRINRHGIACHLARGHLHADRRPHDFRADVERQNALYGTRWEALDRASLSAHLCSPAYTSGVYDPDAAHLDPLALACGLADAAEMAGARLYERTRARRVVPTGVDTDRGAVRATHTILATNGYASLARPVAARVLPVNNFIVATEPVDLADLLPSGACVSDDRFVVGYWRGQGNRLLFGGGETYGDRFPADIRGAVRARLHAVYPQLDGVNLTHAWGGTLAITRTRLPCLWRDGTVLSASGYSGHGLGLSVLAGRLMAEAILGESNGFDTLSRVLPPPFPGGRALRRPIQVLAMSWFSLRDRLGF